MKVYKNVSPRTGIETYMELFQSDRTNSTFFLSNEHNERMEIKEEDLYKILHDFFQEEF